ERGRVRRDPARVLLCRRAADGGGRRDGRPRGVAADLRGARSRHRACARRGSVVRLRPDQRGVHDVTTANLPLQIRERTVAKARTLLEALPFMREHGGRVIVLKYGGAAMETSGLASTFAEDVMLLQSVGIK